MKSRAKSKQKILEIRKMCFRYENMKKCIQFLIYYTNSIKDRTKGDLELSISRYVHIEDSRVDVIVAREIA